MWRAHAQFRAEACLVSTIPSDSVDSNLAPIQREHFPISAFRSVGALLGKQLQRIENCLRWRPHRTLCRPTPSLLWLLVREMNNCYRRILYIHKQKLHLRGVLVGQAFQSDESGNVRWDRRTLHCNMDIEHFLAAEYWRTLIDVELFREGWLRGYEAHALDDTLEPFQPSQSSVK
jgi:hypothetical protein